MLGLCFCVGFFSNCGVQASHCNGVSCCGAWALGCSGFSSCGMWAQLLWGMWDLSRAGIKPCLLHWQVDSLPLSHQGNPVFLNIRRVCFVVKVSTFSKFTKFISANQLIVFASFIVLLYHSLAGLCLSLLKTNIYLLIYFSSSGLSCWGGGPSLRCTVSLAVACGILVRWPGIQPVSPALQGRFLPSGPPGKSWFMSF